MASFWSKIVRALDQFLGDPPPGQGDLDPAVVEEAVRIIQANVDADRKDQSVRRLRVSDLSPERRAKLASELAQLLRERGHDARRQD